MLFRDIKQGSTIYIFDKSDAKYISGKVVSCTLPHIDGNFKSGNQLVVDIGIEAEGEQRTYTMQEGSEVAYVGTRAISATKEGVLREVEALLSQSEQTLNQRSYLEELVARCKRLRVELNPMEKQKAEMEEWKQRMEASMAELKEMLRSGKG